MQMKKFLPSVIIGYILLFGLGYLIHEVWLHADYQATQEVWRARDLMMSKMWVNWVGQLIFVLSFVWIYSRGVENKPWVAQAIRFAIAATLLTIVPGACAEYAVLMIPKWLAIKWMVGGGVQMLVLGLVTAYFHRQS